MKINLAMLGNNPARLFVTTTTQSFNRKIDVITYVFIYHSSITLMVANQEVDL